MTVQILRLKDGCDVISNIETVSPGMVVLEYPMLFELVNQRLVLQHWLPLAAMKGNSVKIPREEIFCTMDPNDAFVEYYTNAVQKMSKVLDNNDEEEMDQMMEALEELEHTKGISIH